MQDNEGNKIYYLLFFSLIICLYQYLGFVGHYGYDDLHYARLANDLLNGELDFSDHFSYRFPILLLTAASYKLLGISDFSSILPSVLVGLATLFTVFLTVRKEKDSVAFFSLVLTSLCFWFLAYSGKIMVDIYLAFSVMLALYSLHSVHIEKGSPSHMNALVFSFALFIGFNAKGTIVLLLLLLIAVFVIDILQRKHVVFWIWSCVFLLVFMSGFFLISWWITGDPGSRFEAIQKNSYIDMCRYDVQPVSAAVKRVAYEFLNLSISQYLFTSYIFITAWLFRYGFRNVMHINTTFSFFLFASVVLFLSSNFMTISPSSYNPMCLDPRHYLFLSPVSAIAAAFILSDFLEHKKGSWILVLVTMAICCISCFMNRNSFMFLYLPLLVLILAYLFVPSKPINRGFFAALFTAVLLIKPVEMILGAQKLQFRMQKQVLERHVFNDKSEKYVIGSDVQGRLGRYYNGYQKNSNVTFLNFHQFDPDTLDDKAKYLMLNWHLDNLSGLEKSDLPYYARRIPSDNELIYRNEELNISIYKLNSLVLPKESGDILLESINDFEGQPEDWIQQPSDRVNHTSHSGEFSMRLNEFSSTFQIVLDSIPMESYDKLLFKASVYAKFIEKPDCKFVLSLDSEEGNYLWEGKDVRKYLRAYGQWTELIFSHDIPVSSIKPNTTLKLYLWKTDDSEAYVDQFRIQILGLKD